MFLKWKVTLILDKILLYYVLNFVVLDYYFCSVQGFGFRTPVSESLNESF